MNPQTFEQFKHLVYQKSGITLGPQKIALVTARVSKRMGELGLTEHDDYLRHVVEDSSNDELIGLIDAIATNVTSFYRESAHFEILSRLVQQRDIAQQPAFRIWCAASATGEEAYSIAMTTLEALGEKHPDFRVLATDISTKALAVAKQGTYTSARLEPVPALLRTRYFDTINPGDNESYRVNNVLKAIVTFDRLNLSMPPFHVKDPMDVIFCRNVMTYFDKAVRTRMVSEMVRHLKPGGYLIIGHAENLAGIDVPLHAIHPAVYRKH